MTEELATEIAKILATELHHWRERESWCKELNRLITLLLEDWPVIDVESFVAFLNYEKD